mmetsp:Transcript_24212/g.45926  ORF Transcript_24212/g.45926 Transcript_24212/m.45926 type:complete len:233 (-) Transcript_24212:8-706(-)
MLAMMPRASRCSSVSSGLFSLASARGVAFALVTTLGSAWNSSSLNASGRQASAQTTQSGVHPSATRGVLMSMRPSELPSTRSCTIRQASLKLLRSVTSHTKCIACDKFSCWRGTPQFTRVFTIESEALFKDRTKACSVKTWSNSPCSAFSTTLCSSSRSPALTASTNALDVLTASWRAMGSSSRSLVKRSDSSSGSSMKAKGCCAKAEAVIVPSLQCLRNGQTCSCDRAVTA